MLNVYLIGDPENVPQMHYVDSFLTAVGCFCSLFFNVGNVPEYPASAYVFFSEEDVKKADLSSADYVLLDSGAGTGMTFNWEFIKGIKRPYFLAGGLDPLNVSHAVKSLNPFAVDVSSGIETDGLKDEQKMTDFVSNVRKES